MKKSLAFIFLIVSVTVFLLTNLVIVSTPAFAQLQETEGTEPVDIGELDLTNLVTEGSLSSVGNNGDDYIGEVDWYVFTSVVDSTAFITLSFDPSNDYDLYLFDANGSIVLDYSVYDNPEILIYEMEASTTYLISVAGWEGSPGDYILTINPGDVGPPEPIDPVELDFTDLIAEGSLSSVGNDGYDYTGEVDWYIFTATVTTTAIITLSFDPGNNYDLYLYDANGSVLKLPFYDDNPEILIYEVEASTIYLISVAGWEGSPGDYTLTITPEEREKSAEIDLPKGWSMISLPVRPDSLKLSELFTDAVVVYGFTKGMGYVRVAEAEDLKFGKGYWILLNKARKYTITGQPVNEYSRVVYEDRWDMIGGCTSPAHASVTNGLIKVIYGFVQGMGYQRILETEKLEPGKGYWILYNDIIGLGELKVEATGS